VLTLTHRRRSRTVIGALITIAVPGALTAAAAVGHLAERTAPAPQAAGLAGTVAGASAGVAGASTLSVAASQRVTSSRAKAPGMRLLTAAAAAGQSASYQGVELISRWTITGTSTALSTVWHASGGRTITQTTDAASGSVGKTQLSYDPYQELPEGVFGVTRQLVALLATHYVAVTGGTAYVAGRTAQIVEVRRPGGTLAARFWLDRQTDLPLRREDYGVRAQVITEATFIQVKFGKATAPSASAVVPAATGTGWDPEVPAALLAKLRTGGWPLPAVLPGGLTLYAGAVSTMRNGAVVALSYSDGLFEVSLFVQQGELAAKPPGWQAAKVSGRSVFVSARGVTWSAQGFVYTVLTDAPPQVVTEAVTALPHDTPPGFWSRLGRGLKRLGRIVDPFR
jgi:sigma-E factor negative regulatory protein RseB